MGGSVADVIRFELTGADADRSLVVIDKIAKTAKKYPRKAGSAVEGTDREVKSNIETEPTTGPKPVIPAYHCAKYGYCVRTMQLTDVCG